MTETKPWWASRTIWVGLAAAVMGILGAAGVLPVWLTQSLVEELIFALLGIATVWYRSQAVKEIQPVLNKN